VDIVKTNYLYFYRAARLEKDNFLNGLDEIAQTVLHEIALHYFNNKPMSVSDVMAMNLTVSPYTIHRKLKKLIEANLIEMSFIGSNRRSKYPTLTKSAIRYFDILSNLMIEALDK
jgi:DNA-binding MarR family transcriptional regulator